MDENPTAPTAGQARSQGRRGSDLERMVVFMSKITVIGAGSVGATIANDLMIQGIASEILLIDINKQKAFGEALDIYQARRSVRRRSCVPATMRTPRARTL